MLNTLIILSLYAMKGPVYSQIKTHYFGWKVRSAICDLVSDLSITAGSRLKKRHLQLNAVAENLYTGLAKHESTSYIQSDPAEQGWVYIALYREQSLAGDQLGIAVLYNTEQLIEITEDQLNHVVVLSQDANQLTYYFPAVIMQPGD